MKVFLGYLYLWTAVMGFAGSSVLMHEQELVLALALMAGAFAMMVLSIVTLCKHA